MAYLKPYISGLKNGVFKTCYISKVRGKADIEGFYTGFFLQCILPKGQL